MRRGRSLIKKQYYTKLLNEIEEKIVRGKAKTEREEDGTVNKDSD